MSKRHFTPIPRYCGVIKRMHHHTSTHKSSKCAHKFRKSNTMINFKSHETMPNEQTHDCFKEDTRKKFNALPKSRQNMNSLFNQIGKTAKNFPKETILTHIRKLPNVLKSIIEKNGGRTKYWFEIFRYEFLLSRMYFSHLFWEEYFSNASTRAIPNRTSPKNFLVNHRR